MMSSMLYEVAVITPYTTAKTFPRLGALDDHASIKDEKADVDLHWFLQPSGDHVSSWTDQLTGSNPKTEQWQELPSCIRSVDSSDFAFSTVSSLTLSTDPCLSDISWGNRELCSTKYDHDEFEGVNFIPVTGAQLLPDLTQATTGERDTGIGTSLTDATSQHCQEAISSELENLLAKIAKDMCALRTERETKTSLADNSEMCKVSLAPNASTSPESSFFVTAMSHITDNDFYRTASSHFDHDDDSSSAFSSCRVSRSSSHCDLHEATKHSEHHELPTATRLRKPLPTIKSVTPMPTMFTPPQNKEGRKLNTLLTLDLESCKSYDTCGSSGYCDSPTASSVHSDFSEFSCLNPLSKPFVPRAWAGVNHEDPCRKQALNFESFAVDSGIEQSHLNASQPHVVQPSLNITRGTNLETLSQNSTGLTNNKNAEETLTYLCSLKHDKELTPFLDYSASNLPEACRTTKTVSAIKSIAQRVVKLRVRKAFSLLPESPSKAAFSSSIFQSRDSNSPVFDHYGTGFVFDIDAKNMHIRTHRKVVGSADEAAQTRVFFSISTEKCVINASCSGEKDGFSLKSNSECAVLKCRTPAELIQHLDVFQELPVQTRTSFFNDSCYYSDLSPDTSISDHEEACADSSLPVESEPPGLVLETTPSKQLTYADVVSSKQQKLEPSCDKQQKLEPSCGKQQKLEPSCGKQQKLKPSCGKQQKLEPSCGKQQKLEPLCGKQLKLEPLCGKQLKSEPSCGKQQKSEPFRGRQIPVEPINPHSPKKIKASLLNSNIDTKSSTKKRHNWNSQPSISVFDMRVRQAFESVKVKDSGVDYRDRAANTHYTKYEIDTPLVMSERQLKFSSKACPYVGETTFGTNGQYSYFSSYAGDVLSSLQPKGGNSELSRPWVYESLVYAQNHQRDSYNRANNLPQSTRRHSLEQDSMNSRQQSWEQDCTNSRGKSTPHSGIKASTCSFSDKPDSRWDSEKFREISSVDAYLQSWDKNLLNLDESLNPLPEYDPVMASSEQCRIKTNHKKLNHKSVIDFDNLVDTLLREDDTDCIKRTGCSCCQKNFLSGEHAQQQNYENEAKSHRTYALIISHPHGGPKVVSVGQLSRHHHIGGDLYDTPTCMGSCGAPVVFLSEAYSEGPLVSHLVHGGTTRSNGVPTGIGFTCFI